MRKWTLWIMVTIAVVIFYQINYGLATLLPTDINWLMSARHDWGTHYLGWAFYKSEPWHFPLGKVTGYNYPVGTNVGFTDSIPLLAIFFKLWKGILPADFQYFGWWLLSCHLLAAYFGVLLLRRFRVNPVITLIGALFIATNPVLVYRGMHPALCAQWLLLAAVYVYFQDPRVSGTKRILVNQLILLAIGAMVNPYLCWMVLGFSVATPAKLCFFDRQISWKKAAVYLGISLFVMVFLWYVTGLVEFGKKEDLDVGGAFGLYAMNLNALFNSFGYSSFLKKLPWVSPHQYEGFMYLGMGIFLLLFILGCRLLYGLVVRRNKAEGNVTKPARKRGNLIPLLILVFLYVLVAVPLVFTYNEKVLLKIPTPALFVRLIDVFRASGRFFWLPYYLIILCTVIGIARMKVRPAISIAIVALAYVLQVYDLRMLLHNRGLAEGPYSPPMDNAAWIRLMSQYDEIVCLPAYQPPPIRFMAYQDFCFLALKAGRPIDLAYVARADSRAMQLYGDSLMSKIDSGKVSPKALYLNGAATLDNFAMVMQTGEVSLHYLDGCYYLYSTHVKNEAVDTMSRRLDALYRVKLDSAFSASGTKVQFREPGGMIASDSSRLHFNLEMVKTGDDYVIVHGWALDSVQNYNGDSLFFTLSSGDKTYWAPNEPSEREDVLAYFPGLHARNTGVNLLAFMDSIPRGVYQLGVAVKTGNGHYIHRLAGTEVGLKIPKYAAPVKLTGLPPEGKILRDINVADEPDDFSVEGWAALPGQDAVNKTIWLVLQSTDNLYAFETKPTDRIDVTLAFKNRFNLDNSGYQVKIAKNSVPQGRYKVGLLIRDSRQKGDRVMFTDRTIEIP